MLSITCLYYDDHTIENFLIKRILSHRFLEAGKFSDIPVLGEDLYLMSLGYSHPLHHVQLRVTDVKSLTTLTRLEVEAVRLNLELPGVLNSPVVTEWCAQIGIFDHFCNTEAKKNSQMLLCAYVLHFDNPWCRPVLLSLRFCSVH